MTDKELLEAAAKVSGIDLNDYEWIEGDGVGTYFMAAGDASHDWNPLENDGDAFRLAVDLGLSVVIVDGHVVCSRYYGEPDTGFNIKISGDRYECQRRAITTAAAQLVKK